MVDGEAWGGRAILSILWSTAPGVEVEEGVAWDGQAILSILSLMAPVAEAVGEVASGYHPTSVLEEVAVA